MKVDMLEVFNAEVARWADAWAAQSDNRTADADTAKLLKKLEARLPTGVRERLGAALHRKALVADPARGRGNFLGPPGGETHQMLTRHTPPGEGPQVWPCWEMFVHMADYGSLEAMSQAHPGLVIGIEDAQMDLSVRQDGELVAYVEVKELQQGAEGLIRELLALTRRGPIPPREKFLETQGGYAKDAIKKANYILDNRERGTLMLAVRSGRRDRTGLLERCFDVTVDGSTRTLDIREVPQVPVPYYLEARKLGTDHDRAVASLVWALHRRFPRSWLKRGSQGTYVLYRALPSSGESPILVGVQRDGKLYTELHALESNELRRFEEVLDKAGFNLGDTGSGKFHRMWRRTDAKPFSLSPEEAEKLVVGLRES